MCGVRVIYGRNLDYYTRRQLVLYIETFSKNIIRGFSDNVARLSHNRIISSFHFFGFLFHNR